MTASLLLTGIELTDAYHDAILTKRPGFAWLEIESEPYIEQNDNLLNRLDQIRQHYPISMHGTGLSLGSADDLNWQHLKQLKELAARIEPCLISGPLAWSSINGHYLHELLPLPYTDESLEHLISRIHQVQEYLGRPILLENIASFIRYTHSTIPENEFLNRIAEKTGCGILLNITHLYINAMNFKFNPVTYLTHLSTRHVQEIHVSGFSSTTIHEKDVLLDTKDHSIVPAVWELFCAAVRQLGKKPTIIEWNKKIPPLDTLYLEAFRAEKILRETYVTAKSTD